mmetsp:Transcript_28857/g.95981  ORF Transcript_28857/g.95981 Transcript_28857/m.95981 type:complete len:299 (+) Transcript_28857:608-1504(+)
MPWQGGVSRQGLQRVSALHIWNAQGAEQGSGDEEGSWMRPRCLLAEPPRARGRSAEGADNGTRAIWCSTRQQPTPKVASVGAEGEGDMGGLRRQEGPELLHPVPCCDAEAHQPSSAIPLGVGIAHRRLRRRRRRQGKRQAGVAAGGELELDAVRIAQRLQGHGQRAEKGMRILRRQRGECLVPARQHGVQDAHTGALLQSLGRRKCSIPRRDRRGAHNRRRRGRCGFGRGRRGRRFWWVHPYAGSSHLGLYGALRLGGSSRTSRQSSKSMRGPLGRPKKRWPHRITGVGAIGAVVTVR